ncbi:transcriptional regulator medusa [Ophiostoma piceae UAMH 11346]|uniref:Transcriptional regulator medusa n=1 Tax=Ophiostoma piceae (strain UAMH 11346) TaxID=1262450 RepID=S3BVH2_OPHP1|nr:transcriptional regulator medusa [Ophiostoma piceae UAMH 11346]
MAAYKTQPAQLHGFADTTYPTFNTPTYQTQQTENATSPLNNMAFNTAPSAGQYLSPTSPTSANPVNIISCGPTAGTAGTRVELKVSSQYDLMAMSPPAPYVWLSFGSQKCHADVVKEAVSQDGLTYIVSAEAPQFMTTNCASPADVPLTVVIGNTSGEELARVPVGRSFTYHDVPSNAGVSASSMEGAAPDANAPSAAEGMTRKSSPGSPGHVEGHHDSPNQLAVRTSVTNSPSQTQNQLSVDSNTNTFAYPTAGVDPTAAAVAQQAQAQNNFAAAAAAAVATSYNQDNTNMLGAYRSASFSDGFSRGAGPQPVRAAGGAPNWNTPSYGSISHQGGHHNPHDRYNMGRSHSIAHVHGTSSITRPHPSASLPAPSHGSVPQLIRTSTIQSSAPGSIGSMSSASSYGGSHWGSYPAKAVLNIQGNLDTMAQEWTPEEWNNRRRIVMFRKKQNGSHLEATFRPIPINERPPNSICISCIYWAEKQECFVTSVDTINLLEQLVAAPARFTVEEKNRIRRNLEGFKPFTVSKAKAESEEFFKLIMAFGAPKPRTIEKDVKVFPWKILGQALKKIISKYSASPSVMPSSSGPSGQGHHMLTPVTMSPSYPVLPPTPGSLSTGPDGASAVSYVNMVSGTNGADSLASPRSLSGASWVSYAGNATGRALSPGSSAQKPQSPGSTHLRMGGMPSYDARGSTGSSGAGAHAYGHHQHHTQTFNSPLSMPTSSGAPAAGSSGATAGAPTHRWDNYSVASGSAPGPYGSSHHHQQQQPQHGNHGHLYGTTYGESVQRT